MDEASLRRVLNRHFGAELVAVDSADEAVEVLTREKFALVLVNRIFDRDGDEGLAFIARIKGQPELAETPMMLISNYPNFQIKAEQLGAAPGVGKSTLSSPESLARLGAFLSGKNE